jgi:hypothetical protein
LSRYTVPDVSKATIPGLEALEGRRTKIGILVLDMHNAFYLNDAQLELARGVRYRCGISVVYETANVSTVTADRYGFSDVVPWEEFRLVDLALPELLLYQMPEPVTLNGAVDFCREIAVGQIAPVAVSPVERLDADGALQYVQDGWAAVAFCEGEPRCFRNVSIVARDLRAFDLRIAAFEGPVEEWPSDLGFRIPPSWVIFADGAVVAAIPAKSTPPSVIAGEIARVYNRARRDAL